MAHLLSLPLQHGFCFFHPLLPAAPSACLTACLPLWESYGLTTFRLHTNERVRVCLFAGDFPVCVSGRGKPVHLATYLLVQAYQRLWLVGSHDVYQQFTSVTHTALILAPAPPCAGSDNLASQLGCYSYEFGYIVPEAIVRMIAPSPRSGRILVAEYQVTPRLRV